MKIAVITEIINNHSGSRAPLEIARHLAKLGTNVTVYAHDTMLDQKVKKSLEKDNVKITMVHKPQIKFINKLIAAYKLSRILRVDKPDFATFSATSPFFASAKLAKLKIIRIYQGAQFDAFLETKTPDQKPTIIESQINKLANLYIYLTELTLYRFSVAVIAISRFCAEEGKRLYKKKVDKIIYHGTSPIWKLTARKNSDVVRIISVSRITPYKGFHLIINALKLINTKRRVELIIAGSAPKPNYLKYLQKISPSNVKIILNPSDKQLSKLYAQADIYTNADRYLFFGLPICEAGHFKLPTISFNFAAAQEIVAHGKSGFVAKDEKEFARYLKTLIENKSLREKMGNEAKMRSTDIFTWENAAKNYIQLFNKLIAKK